MPASSKVKVSGSISSLTTDMAILRHTRYVRIQHMSGAVVPSERHDDRDERILLPCPDLIRASIILQKRWIAGSSPAMTELPATELPALLRPHQVRKPLEQIMRVARAG